MADLLSIAPGLRLDADYVGGGTFAMLAKKGAGKSYLARVMAEEFWRTGVPFVLLDPMGASWGLRSSADGQSEGIPVAIFGGDHGDAPLERGAGAMLADLVVDERLSMILDMEKLGTRAAERQFAHDFLDRLYRRNRDLVHLLIDEADLFAPQSAQQGDRPLLGVTENIVRRGRNHGIGCTLMTQRPAVLNKDVLTQIDGMIAMRIIGLQDREAVDKWVAGHGEDDEEASKVKATLKGLANGECWWWVPELSVLKRVQVRESHTFDSSPTRKRGERRAEPKSYADVDMGSIEKKIASTIERAKADDPRELRKRIRDLEREVSECANTETETEVREVEVEVFPPGLPDTLDSLADDLDVLATTAGALRERTLAINGNLPETPMSEPRPAPRPPARVAPPRRDVPTTAPTGTFTNPSTAPAGSGPPVHLTGPQQRVLDALAWLKAVGFSQPTKIQIGFIAGYRVGKRVGGTFGNVLGQLKSSGLIDYPTAGNAALTDVGLAQARVPDIEQTTGGLQRAIFARLNPPESRVLFAVVDAYPDAITKQQAGEQAGYTVGDRVGGTFGNILGRLRSLGLIDYPAPGTVRAEPVLFLEDS